MKYLITVLSIIAALCYAVFGCFLVWRDYGLWVIAAAAAMVVALPLSSLLHELGHMLFGALCKIKAVPSFSLFGSSCCKLIPKTDEGLRFRLFFTALGGVLTNLVIGVLANVALKFNAPSWLVVIVPANLYLFMLNNAPVQLNSGKTDGYVCNELLNNTDSAKVMVAVLTVQAQVLKGKPIQEVDEKLLFDLPVIQEDDESFISLTELRYEYYKAKGEEEKAAAQLSRLEELKKEYM